MSKASGRKKGTRKKKRNAHYSKGEINKLVDGLIHPLAKADKSYILLDGLLHALNERNPPQSLRKFMKYDLPEIVKATALKF